MIILEFIYPFFISFILVFISELGDKTQLIALSFSSKLKFYIIILGVALGSFFSHGIAILFGSFLGNIENTIFQNILKIITYTSFIIFGIITIKQKNSDENILSKNNSIMKKNISYILFIAFSIAIGELGDKTFLASIGLGIQYPCFKIMLICGAIFGMIVSDSIAIIFGKFLSKKVTDNIINLCSGLLFLIFGFIGFINFIL